MVRIRLLLQLFCVHVVAFLIYVTLHQFQAMTWIDGPLMAMNNECNNLVWWLDSYYGRVVRAKASN